MCKLLIVLLLAVMPFKLNSQSFIGLEVGYTASNILMNPKTLDFIIHSGFSGGINYNFRGNNRISIHTGLRVQQYGHDYRSNLINENGNVLAEGRVQNRVMSLNVPLRLGYSFGDKFTITPNLGLSFHYALSANSVLPKSFTGLGSLSKSQTFLNQIQPFQLSIAFSTEFATKIKDIDVFANIEYQQGLTNVFNESSSPPNSTHRYIIVGLNLGCRIPMFQKIENTSDLKVKED